MDKDKKEIINRFCKNVKGKKADTGGFNKKHDGAEGHWLEKQMGIALNADNKPDLFGYEMKNHTSSGKITYGDWSADEYIYLHGRGPNKVNSINKNYQISRDDFLKIFGKPNSLKNNRLSWSGTPCPTYYGDITTFGQSLAIDANKNVIITYSFSKDQRLDKSNVVPTSMQTEDLIIAKWHGSNLRLKVERKFNQNGWFTCTKNNNGKYESISFGSPMNYNSWMQLFKNKIVFFHSGMYQGNNRPYSQWRASTGYWHSLIKDTY